MPRLLLVDDNPSIHKIAETLLAASDVELISCASGAAAMALVDQGDRFDVALLDTSMLGMDGWALLQRLRETEATARMPVAMMAGILDIVDPEKLRLAPIQGFLKKPVELRDLGERIKRLLETPVPPPADDDLLLLGPEDVLPEAAPVPSQPLELEELDLEGLRNLAEPAATPAPAEAEAPADDQDRIDLTVPEFLLTDTYPDVPEAQPLTGVADSRSLPDLGPGPMEAGEVFSEPLDWSDDSDTLVAMALGVQEPTPFPLEPALAPTEDAVTLADAPPPMPPTPPVPTSPAPTGELAPDPLAALLADPVLLDRLAKALVARMGERVLREIAWEVMPDLAERMRRQETP